MHTSGAGATGESVDARARGYPHLEKALTALTASSLMLCAGYLSPAAGLE